MLLENEINCVNFSQNRDNKSGFLSGFWSRGVEMRRNVLLGGQSYIIFLKAKHMTN